MNRLNHIADGAFKFVRRGACIAVLAYSVYSLFSHNGLLDSPRMKETGRYHSDENHVKTVANVRERWEDDNPGMINKITLNGYNPKVIREIVFDDGSRARLEYRTLAWQPIMRWKNGEEFNPRPGEKYEVTPGNLIVRKM
ncbi:MAG TPA: hypothetical protein VJH95_01290 [Candidatus Nanoarchaeia archaeon]|nr:hypothetical protein [Candidatus Nanoarchaeia archaeon]